MIKQKKILFFLLLILQSCNGSNENFSLCGLGIVKPYYFTGLRYNGGMYRIEKEFKTKFIPLTTDATGIAKIRFKVNCKGMIGDLDYEEYNINYRVTNLNDSIESQIVKITSNLDDWISGTDDEGNLINSHSFLSFKIENGEIIEILPK